MGRDGITAAADAFTPTGHGWQVPGHQKSSQKQGRSKKQKKNQQQNLEVYCCNAEAEQVVLGTALACP